MRKEKRLVWIVLLAALTGLQAARAQDPLPSWNETPAKKAILQYVEAVTTPGSPDYISPPDRIATFDQDGTLVTEMPLSLEAYFMVASVKQTLLDEPDKKASPAEKIVAAGNDSAVNSLPGKDYDEVFEETYKGDSQEEFRDRVLSWALSWKHPRFGTGIEKLVYQPMRELMDFLRASGFTVFVVTGSNEDFTRAYSRELYGVPENQVIGSESALKYKVIDNRSFVVKQSHQEVATVGPNKPVMIEKHIGKRPVFAAGNGTSDPDMLTYVSDNKRKNFCLLIRHDDPGREYEYYIPKLEELAQKKGFLIVNMKEDWKTIFPE